MLSKSLMIATLVAYLNSSLVSSSPVVTVPTATQTAVASCLPTAYAAKGGDVWTTQCNQNYFGSAPGGSNSVILGGSGGFASLGACIESCDSTYPGTCTATVFYRTGGQAGHCFCLKNTSNGGQTVDGIDAALLQVQA